MQRNNTHKGINKVLIIMTSFLLEEYRSGTSCSYVVQSLSLYFVILDKNPQPWFEVHRGCPPPFVYIFAVLRKGVKWLWDSDSGVGGWR